MSSLTDIEKRYLEKILGMQTGWVLDYKDTNYGEFFGRYKIHIHGPKYQKYGTSKAKKMRAFWELESDALVGTVLSEMLDSYEAYCDLNDTEIDVPLLDKARSIVGRLTGQPPKATRTTSLDSFLNVEMTVPDIHKLPIEDTVIPIVRERLDELNKAFGVGAYLSVVILCGSILEGVLLGKAQREPAIFNSSRACPKTDAGKPKRFHEWTLAQFIDVSSELGILQPDVKKFSHGLRDFRNYIHPYQQLSSGFTPDEHTAKVCFQVLKAALAGVAGKR